MFCKSLIVFGLLAAFFVQGMEATQLDTRTVELRGLGDLIDQVKQLIKNLNGIVSGVLANAEKTLKDSIDIIKAIQEKFLNLGLKVIADAFTKGVDFITSKIEEAAKLGINIAKCTAGTQELLVGLATDLTGTLSDCITKPVNDGIKMITNDLKIVGDITKNIGNLPTELTKCMISLKPIDCVTGMVSSLTKLVLELPGQIKKLVGEVTTFVTNLPETLGECVNGISVTMNFKVDALIGEVSECVDELMPESTFRF